MLPIESALIVVVPEAEQLVGPFREKYDPSAAAGMPSHITLLYPFTSPDDISQAELGSLSLCFARVGQFDFSLAAIRRFAGGVLYLAPEPDEPFRRLTLAIWKRYPKLPPYGGKHSSIVPHLTVAQLADERQLDRIADQFARDSQGKLPIRATASEIALMEKRVGSWQARTTLALG
jgi:2'-5' RNA ligase